MDAPHAQRVPSLVCGVVGLGLVLCSAGWVSQAVADCRKSKTAGLQSAGKVWQDGRMAGWQDGRMAGWQDGRMTG